MRISQKISVLFIVLLTVLMSACNNDGKTGGAGPEEGSISGSAVNASTDAPLENVHVVVKDSSGIEVAATDTDINGAYSVTLPAGKSYNLEFTLAAFYTETYSNIAVLKNEENILAAVLQIDTSITGTGTISGTIRDAQDDTPIVGAVLNFRVGINAQTGTIIGTTTTDALGDYTLATLNTGNYTCEIILSGYTTAYASVLVLGGDVIGNQSSSLSKILQVGETRIVLRWGKEDLVNMTVPADLDAHITGPTGVANDRFHIYFAEQGVDDVTVTPFVQLDHDDITYEGPETITIGSQFQGTYRYSVHDFSSYNLTDTPDSRFLASSKATVTLYQANANPRVFNVPAGIGVLWTVFELNGTTVTPINTMADTLSISSIQSVLTNSDQALFKDIPRQK